MAADLLPCPFCGGHARLWGYGSGAFAVSCDGCEAETPQFDEDDSDAPREDALAAWNRRAQPLAAPATTTGVPLPDPSDAMVDDWKCPRCGSDQTWFDRTEPMATRCSNCGRDVNAGDDTPATIGVECVSNGDATIDYAASGIATPPAAPAAVTAAVTVTDAMAIAVCQVFAPDITITNRGVIDEMKRALQAALAAAASAGMGE